MLSKLAAQQRSASFDFKGYRLGWLFSRSDLFPFVQILLKVLKNRLTCSPNMMPMPCLNIGGLILTVSAEVPSILARRIEVTRAIDATNGLESNVITSYTFSHSSIQIQ